VHSEHCGTSTDLRNTDIGALINVGSAAGQELFEVSDLHRMRILRPGPTGLLGALRQGLKATFEMPALNSIQKRKLRLGTASPTVAIHESQHIGMRSAFNLAIVWPKQTEHLGFAQL